jgi:hypothetical protein
VAVSANGDLDRLAGFLQEHVAGVDSAAVVDGRVHLGVRGGPC